MESPENESNIQRQLFPTQPPSESPQFVIHYPNLPLPTFNGENLNPHDFIQNWKNIAQANWWPKSNWHFVIGPSLKGSAYH